MHRRTVVSSKQTARRQRMHVEQCQFWFLAPSTEVHEMIVGVLQASRRLSGHSDVPALTSLRPCGWGPPSCRWCDASLAASAASVEEVWHRIDRSVDRRLSPSCSALSVACSASRPARRRAERCNSQAARRSRLSAIKNASATDTQRNDVDVGHALVRATVTAPVSKSTLCRLLLLLTVCCCCTLCTHYDCPAADAAPLANASPSSSLIIVVVEASLMETFPALDYRSPSCTVPERAINYVMSKNCPVVKLCSLWVTDQNQQIVLRLNYSLLNSRMALTRLHRLHSWSTFANVLDFCSLLCPDSIKDVTEEPVSSVICLSVHWASTACSSEMSRT